MRVFWFVFPLLLLTSGTTSAAPTSIQWTSETTGERLGTWGYGWDDGVRPQVARGAVERLFPHLVVELGTPVADLPPLVAWVYEASYGPPLTAAVTGRAQLVAPGSAYATILDERGATPVTFSQVRLVVQYALDAEHRVADIQFSGRRLRDAGRRERIGPPSGFAIRRANRESQVRTVSLPAQEFVVRMEAEGVHIGIESKDWTVLIPSGAEAGVLCRDDLGPTYRPTGVPPMVRAAAVHHVLETGERYLVVRWNSETHEYGNLCGRAMDIFEITPGGAPGARLNHVGFRVAECDV